MNRILAILCSTILLISFIGCQKQDSDILLTAVSQLDTAQHTEQLHEYDSPYTICYKNKDNTYSLYIFASPIQYQLNDGSYAIIDNTIVKSEKEGFAYENKANEIKTYFPKTLDQYFRIEKNDVFQEFKPFMDCKGFSKAKSITYINMYGDKVNAVRYQREDMDMIFYPTKAGIKAEVLLKEELQNQKNGFILKTKAPLFENLQNGYILFKNGGENESIIYQPLVQYTTDSGQHLDITTPMNIEKKEGDYYVEMIINDAILKEAEYPIKFDLSFELYLNKMPDTSVYSKFDVNSYLRHYAVIGDHPVLGEGWHYVRSRLNYLFGIQPGKILSVNYSTYIYSSLRDNLLSMYQLDQTWSSTKMVWDDRQLLYDKCPISNNFCERNNSISFDITQFAKACFSDSSFQTESNGFLLKSNYEGDYIIISTSDNSLHSPYLRLKLSDLPVCFDPKENINPT